jgi:hypothetical protein
MRGREGRPALAVRLDLIQVKTLFLDCTEPTDDPAGRPNLRTILFLKEKGAKNLSSPFRVLSGNTELHFNAKIAKNAKFQTIQTFAARRVLCVQLSRRVPAELLRCLVSDAQRTRTE